MFLLVHIHLNIYQNLNIYEQWCSARISVTLTLKHNDARLVCDSATMAGCDTK